MMLSNITVPLLGLVDTAVLGHLEDASYLAGVALSNTLFTSVFWLFGFLRMGTCGMTAQAVGQGDQQRILQLLLSSFWFAIVTGSVLIAFQTLWLPVGLELLSGQSTADTELADALRQDSHQVLTQASLYADWRILGAPFVLLNYALIGWFVGRQNTRVPLLMLISANLINIVLDLVLVLYLKLGVQGVALATVCADISSVLIGLLVIRRNYLSESTRIQRWTPQWTVIKDMVHVNRYIFVRTGVLLLTFALFTSLGARLGESYLAANAVLLTFLLLISSALDGFAHGAEALVGEACGKKDHTLVTQVIKVSLLWSGVSAIVLWLAFGLGGSALIAGLTSLENIQTLANQYLIWLIFMPLIGTWCYTFDGVFIGATKVRDMQNIMLISTFAVFVPMLWWVHSEAASPDFANHLLWLSMSLFMCSRSLGMGLIARRYTQHHRWF
jgi:MATE family multidrug resistance protein